MTERASVVRESNPLGILVLLAACAIAGGGAERAAGSGDPSEVGAYCPFPKQGETPACFAPVERKYGAFFAAVDSGKVGDAELEALELELATAGSDEGGYLAISSLAYGYFRLAERAASSANPDPALVARIANLNDLLSRVYDNPNARPEFRSAVRAAAEDLHARAPAVSTPCEPGADRIDCQTTGTLLEALKQIDDPTADRGVRGALGHLLERVTGTGAEARPHAPPVGASTE